MFKKLKKWFETKIREILDKRIIRLGGHTQKEYDDLLELCESFKNVDNDAIDIIIEACAFSETLVKQIKYVQSEIAIDPKYGYTRDNIIEASKAQTMFKLGQEVYKYANHSITNDGTYLCTVTVMHMDVKDRVKEAVGNV